MAGGKRKKKRPQKPLSIKAVKARGYTPAYEKRLINAIRKARKSGKKPTRQLARGHKKQEHIQRREREKLMNRGLTRDQIKTIERWHSDTFNPREYREVPTIDELVEWSQENSYERFKLYRHTWDAARRQYVGELKDGTWESRGMGYLYQLTNSARVDDYRWLYYH